MGRQDPKAHEGPAAQANSTQAYKKQQERARDAQQKRPSSHAHGTMSADDLARKPDDRNNTCHDPA